MSLTFVAGSSALDEGIHRVANPVIEIATYAGVDVYECYCRGKESNIVMRRIQDDWINITQVFKVASFSKTQRTKILEKESTDINHQKIQGGYGRFQGTWIPLEDAVGLVAKYKITEIVVLTLINFKSDPMNMPPRRSKNSVIKKLSPATMIISPSSYNKTPEKKNLESTHSFLGSVSKKGKKRTTKKMTQPSPLQQLVFQTPQHQPNMQIPNNKFTIVPHSQQTPVNDVNFTESNCSGSHKNFSRSATRAVMLPSSASEERHVDTSTEIVESLSVGNSQHDSITQKPLQFYPFPVPSNKVIKSMQDLHIISEYPQQKKKGSKRSNNKQRGSQSRLVMSTIRHAEPNLTGKVPTFCVMKPTNSHKNSSSSGSNSSYGSSLDCYSFNDTSTTSCSSRSASPHHKSTSTISEYKNLIIQVLSTEYNTCEPVLPEKLYYPPQGLDLNFVIDKQGHIPLHWATAMANLPLIKILLTLDADVFHCNDRGFNCVTKCVFYNNCYRTGAFLMVINLLKMCLITPDSNGRLPLHYLMELSVNNSKDPVVTNYYIDTILEVLSQDDTNLLKFCLNYQDNAGNSCLHLASLNSNVEFCSKFYYMATSVDSLKKQQQSSTSIVAKSNVVPPGSDTTNAHPAVISAQIMNQNQESMDLAQAKPFTPIYDNKASIKLNEDKLASEKKKLSETTFSQTTMPIDDNNSSDLIQILPSTNLKNSSSNIKPFGLDRFLEPHVVPITKLTSPKINSAKELSPNTPSNFLTQNPIHTRQGLDHSDLPRVSNAARLVNTVAVLSKFLSDSYEQNIKNIKLDIDTTLKDIAGVEKSLARAIKSLNEILFKSNVSDLGSLKVKVQEAQSNVNHGFEKYGNAMEKSQALALATFVHEEEHKVESFSSGPSSSDRENLHNIVKLALELSLYQLNRKFAVSQTINLKTNINFGTKVSKYRKLIGLSIDNIDSKLDDIENDLHTIAT